MLTLRLFQNRRSVILTSLSLSITTHLLFLNHLSYDIKSKDALDKLFPNTV